MRRLLSLSILALAAAAAQACGGDASESRTLNYYFTYDPRSLDPAVATDVPTGEMVAMLFDNLTLIDAEGVVHPGLARSWETDSTGRVYTFHLRGGVTFHDGRPLTARDVVASLRRSLEGTNQGLNVLAGVRGARDFAARRAQEVSGLAAPDDTTLVVTLDQPLNIFPKLMAMPVAAVVPASPPADFDQRPVGSGPWKFVSWAHDDQLVLAKNERHWGMVPKSDSLRVRIVPEPLTQAAEYEAGRLSVVEVPFGETRRWEDQHGEEIQRRPAMRVLYIAMNTNRGPLKDARVRRALNHAVDAGTILKNVMAGRGVRSAGSIPPGVEGYDSTRAPYAYDPAKAKQLLAEAGHPNGFALQLWRSQRPEYGRIAQAVQQQLAQVGVRVEIVERDASSARAASAKGEADLFLTDWYGDYPDPEAFHFPTFHSSNKGTGGNRAFFGDPRVDGFIERARTTPDSALKLSLSREVDAMVFEQAPWIYLWFPVDMWAVRPEVEGYRVPAIFYGQRWTDARVTAE